MASTRALIPRDGKVNLLADAEMSPFLCVTQGTDADHVKYPAAVTEMPTGLIPEGSGAAAAEMPVAVLLPGMPGAAKLSGTCAKGDHLCPAVDGSGALRAVPTTAGKYWAFARALTAAANGQVIPVVTYAPVETGPMSDTQGLTMPMLTADPSAPVTGQLWGRSDLAQIRMRVGTTTYVTQMVAALLAFIAVCAALFLAPCAGATDKTVMIRSGTGSAIQAEATASDTVLIPGNVNIGSGNATIDGATGNVEFKGTATIGTFADAEIAAIAALTSAANQLPYFTGSGTASNTTLSAYIRGLLDDADEATLKASINLEIGSDVQAYDADLTTYAGITPSANVQTLLGAANMTAFQTSLGVLIGTDVQAYDVDLADLADGNLTYTKVGVPAVRSLTQSVAVTEFTDDLGTSGHLDLSTQIPAHSRVLHVKCAAAAGWTGDTFANVTFGVAGATGAFSAETNDIFGVTTVNTAPVAATAAVDAPTTVRMTITGNADFTSIKTAAAGAANVTLYYLQTE